MTYMTEGMLPDTYILLFIFFGLVMVALGDLIFLGYVVFKRITAPTPKAKWEKEWKEIEKNIGGGE